MNDTTIECKGCKYWERGVILLGEYKEDVRYGYCHRYPGRADSNQVALFPMRRYYDWCGEWKPQDVVAL